VAGLFQCASWLPYQYAAIAGYSSSLNMICSTVGIERRVDIANIFTTKVPSERSDLAESLAWSLSNFWHGFCSLDSLMLLIPRSQNEARVRNRLLWY
jgi:hypothetical protein